MDRYAIRYVARQWAVVAVVTLIPASFVGGLKLMVEVAYGHSLGVSLGPAALFFSFVYVAIVVPGLVVFIVTLRKKARQAGVSLEYLGSLSRSELKKFENEHGI